MDIKFKRIRNDVITPRKGSEYAAGYDLCAWDFENCNHSDYEGWSIIVPPKTTIKINTGICMAIPEGYFGGIYARSGLATKQGLAPANKVGVIDSDYRGEIIVALYNHSDLPVSVHKWDRIAQLVIQPIPSTTLQEVDTLDDTERGAGGFGSSGI